MFENVEMKINQYNLYIEFITITVDQIPVADSKLC